MKQQRSPKVSATMRDMNSLPPHKPSHESSVHSHQNVNSSSSVPLASPTTQSIEHAIEHEVSDFARANGEPQPHSEDFESHAQSNIEHGQLQRGSSIPVEVRLASRLRDQDLLSSSEHHAFNLRPLRPTPSTTHTEALSQELDSTPDDEFDMLPPPDSVHPTWQTLYDFAQAHASAHGYALSINTTAKNRSRIKLACVCYGAPKNTHKLTAETRVRKNRVSYKTGCKMWVEGKKQEDGTWLLRVGEPLHNHPGRSIEGWASQRKRTWGMHGGRIGVGGVTAKEERLEGVSQSYSVGGQDTQQQDTPCENGTPSHSLERGGLVWKIVEQEMMRKPGAYQGRDRGVGLTLRILELRLPGIHIFKRDIYNIRAQIKRARKAAGQEVGEGLTGDEDEGEHERASNPSHRSQDIPQMSQEPREEIRGGAIAPPRAFPEIDPMLVAQCNDALQHVTRQEETEVERLRKEVTELRQALAQRTREVEEKNSENESLRVQVELANVALYNERDGQTQ
ncbi:hypothetical protein BU24DRAFT_422628 [Aaosphaeria arxii CBS 175.79]|uniref:FAR1 domain-containing protein n=1 Tax=Aaosphaeria arxii CBS 175.79 TaxID=1450172 RepID=A0A6A5XTP8_9PLEO|nr:uncharacterized protein BU24DRAFT_422628 [Aaosphaeria arxii CBS 175.79]KAF2016286.1 hypothetical protein BU24DRAFT_422628 [Aaosphaeria arxii CBS 175.79]